MLLSRSHVTGYQTIFTHPQRINTEPKDRKSTRLNSSHSQISYAVFCLKKKKKPVHFQEPQGLCRPGYSRRPAPGTACLITFCKPRPRRVRSGLTFAAWDAVGVQSGEPD